MNPQTKKRRILIATYQDLPHPDKPPTGGSLRAYGLGEALRGCGHDIVYAIPPQCLDDRDAHKQGIKYVSYDLDNIQRVVDESRSEIVIFCNWGLAAQAAELDVPVVVDINGSLVLENYYRGKRRLLDDALTKLKALSKTDLVLAGSLTQKRYLIGWCLMAGMDPEQLVIEVLPFSLPPQLPEPQPPEDPLFIMAGYEWPWLDGQSAVEIVGQELEKLQRGQLNIYSPPPPYTDVINGEDSSFDLIGRIQTDHLKRVRRFNPISFEALIRILSRSSVALDLWSQNLERELAFPTRAVVYLWSGLPVIGSPQGDLYQMIKRYQAGWLVDPRDSHSLIQLVRNIITIPDWSKLAAINAQRLVADHLTWDKTIAPLDRFCQAPRKKRNISQLLKTMDTLIDDRDRLAHKLDNTRQALEGAQRNIQNQKQRISDLQVERNLMGSVHRRPKGFAILTSWPFARQKLKRILVGLPILSYLMILTTIGYYLHRLYRLYSGQRGNRENPNDSSP